MRLRSMVSAVLAGLFALCLCLPLAATDPDFSPETFQEVASDAFSTGDFVTPAAAETTQAVFLPEPIVSFPGLVMQDAPRYSQEGQTWRPSADCSDTAAVAYRADRHYRNPG